MQTATPAMARAINDRLALDLLLEQGPLTAPQLRALTGLSRPTVSDLVERLRDGGLIEVTGERGSDRRGPNARLYGIVAGRAHVAGVDLRRDAVQVTVADITGTVVGSARRPLPGAGGSAGSRPSAGGGLPAFLADTVSEAAGAHTPHTVVIGAPGLVAPSTGELAADNAVPGWHPGLREDVARRLGVPVVLENEVNLAAIAEHRTGTAAGRDDFALLWLDNGIGGAVVLGGRLRRGASGGAGEVGLLSVDGTTICDLLLPEALGGRSPDEAARRVAQAAFLLVAVLDPGLVVLAGSTARAGGDDLAVRVAEQLQALSPAPTEVRASTVDGNAILQGAVLTALDGARDAVFGHPVAAPG
ncbi:ROK family transcriptional regulator [Actinomadura yumaensis]|uniref:ROK family transcriptional regulator n=1 Tax=Actinomadura yumaensis TaxID=111807 RepID=A0ABW2CST9_9ACTN